MSNSFKFIEGLESCSSSKSITFLVLAFKVSGFSDWISAPWLSSFSTLFLIISAWMKKFGQRNQLYLMGGKILNKNHTFLNWQISALFSTIPKIWFTCHLVGNESGCSADGSDLHLDGEAEIILVENFSVLILALWSKILSVVSSFVIIWYLIYRDFTFERCKSHGYC